MQINAQIVRTDDNQVRISIENGKLIVSAPIGMKDDDLQSVLLRYAGWIKKNAGVESCGKQKGATNGAIEFGNVELASDMFAFKKVLLVGKLFEVVGGECNKPYIEGNKIVVGDKAFRDTEGRKKAVVGFLKMVAKHCLRQEISQFGTSFALCPAAINVTRLKSSGWIRCADMSNRIVSVDYRAVQLPYELRNYLIAHVFSHFFQPGHDEKFFRVLSNYLPNFQQLQHKLDGYAFLKEIG